MMMTPEIPSNELERVCALQELQMLDTPPETRFDDITQEAMSYFQVPIALVSLVDSTRQWFKSCQGLGASETDRNISFCGHAINHDDILYVPNALEDLRFSTNPLVLGEPFIRFYAGAPLIIRANVRVGTLCIIDSQPREFSDEELAVLRELANVVQYELCTSPANSA